MIKQQQYSPSEVLISIREPYDKNTLWIHPCKDYTELKIYNEGWKLLFSTKDLGLSKISSEQVDEKIKNSILLKQINKLSKDLLLLANKNLELEKRIAKLEKK